jgi:hypothetical protein
MTRKRVQKSQVGSLAANLHEGSRSELLAQYVFASFGTAIAVPPSQDTGVDLYCTITERSEQRAWTRHYYTVQVKSGMDPWEFRSRESVGWLVKHPLPLFLCVIDKSKLRLRLYQTFPRFLVWIGGELPTSLELVPAEGYEGTEPLLWSNGESFSLQAPVLDVLVGDLCDDQVQNNTRAVIEFWLKHETYNLTMAMAGIPHLARPHPYETNSPKLRGISWQGAGAGWGIDSMRETLAAAIARLGDFHWRRDDLPGMARVALLSRYLWRKPDHDTLAHALADIPFVQQVLNNALDAKGDFHAGVDFLSEKFDELLASHHVSPKELHKTDSE